MARPGRHIAPCLGLRVMGRARGASRLGMHQGVLTVVARPDTRRVARCVVQRSLLLAVECMTRVLHVRPGERAACMHAVFACCMARERKTSATLRMAARDDGGTDDFWFHAAALPPHQPSGGRRRHHMRRPCAAHMLVRLQIPLPFRDSTHVRLWIDLNPLSAN